jgi:lipooligosaccharide transport system permease protein
VSRWWPACEYWLVSYRRTWRGSVVTTVVEPVLFLLALGVGLGSLIDASAGRVDGVRYAVYLAPGLLAATAMQTGQGSATWPVMGAIKWDRTYHAMLATPLSVDDVLFGHLAFMALRVATSAAAFTVVTAVFGLTHSPRGAVLAMLAATLTGVAFATPVAAFSATQARETGFVLLYRFAVIPLFLFSGTFFPVGQLPALLRPVAYLTPLWHGVALCRDAALGRGSAAALAVHAGYLAALAAGGAWCARRTFARRLRG